MTQERVLCRLLALFINVEALQLTRKSTHQFPESCPPSCHQMEAHGLHSHPSAWISLANGHETLEQDTVMARHFHHLQALGQFLELHPVPPKRIWRDSNMRQDEKVRAEQWSSLVTHQFPSLVTNTQRRLLGIKGTPEGLMVPWMTSVTEMLDTCQDTIRKQANKDVPGQSEGLEDALNAGEQDNPGPVQPRQEDSEPLLPAGSSTQAFPAPRYVRVDAGEPKDNGKGKSPMPNLGLGGDDGYPSPLEMDADRVKAERVEAERVEAERVEAERVEAERVKAERVENNRAIDDVLVWRSILIALLFWTAPDSTPMLNSGVWDHIVPII